MRYLVTLPGNIHPLARPEYDQGTAPEDLPMERMLLVLQRAPEQESALQQLLANQQTKSSPRFHQWLTPEEFGQQFGPAGSDIQAVTDWLTGQGFRVNKVSAGRAVIEFSGTAGLVRQALGAAIHKFVVNGHDYWANASNPQIPAALAPVVAGIHSLNSFPRKLLVHSAGPFLRSKLTGEIEPLFTLAGAPVTYYLVSPTDFATIYNVAPLWANGTDGTGQTIAVVGQTNINLQDVRDFRNIFGLPPNDPNIILNGPDPGIVPTDEPEADLDVQWTGAVARGATIDFVVSESTETTAGVDLSALYVIDNNLAPVMSESYGSCERGLGSAGNAFYRTLWEQAAAQGITVVVATGDAGAAGCDFFEESSHAAQYGLAVSGLASTPFNVAVGGTDFNDVGTPSMYWDATNHSTTQASAKSYIPENAWNDTCARTGSASACVTVRSNGLDLFAGGGGRSDCVSSTGALPSVTCSGGYAKPSWQTGPGVPNDLMRDVPDLSMLSGSNISNSFYLVCQMDANIGQGSSTTSCDLNAPYADIQGAGGTSASAQVFAGIMALVNQAHGRQGNANYVLYPLAAQPGKSCTSTAAAASNSSCIFYDVVTGNNSVACVGGTPHCSNTITASGQYGIIVASGSAAYSATPGYDLATGIGSVNAYNLVNSWTSNFTATTTMLSPIPSGARVTLTHGQPFSFTVSVAPTSGSGTPAGDVSLMVQGSDSQDISVTTGIGSFPLSGGSVTSTTNMLPGGSYTLTAHYAGNGTYGASDSAGIPVKVSPESSKTFLHLVTFDLNGNVTSTNASTAAYGSPYVLRMEVTNSTGQPCAASTTGLTTYPCPAGTITVSPTPTDQNPPSGAVPGSYKLNSQGYVENQPLQLSPSSYNFVATYGGDNSYNASSSATVPITITPAATLTTLASVPTSVFAGTAVTLTASFSTGFTHGVAPTGSIQFLINGSPVGVAAITGVSLDTATHEFTGQAALTTSLPAGVVTISARYLGDANYGASISTATTVTVTDLSLSRIPSP